MLTPPDWYTEHMAMRGARPMVVPWKDLPLQEKEKNKTHAHVIQVGPERLFPWDRSKWLPLCVLTLLTFPDYSQEDKPSNSASWMAFRIPHLTSSHLLPQ